MKYKRTIGVRLDDKLYNVLRENAKRNERTIPQEVRYVLRKYYRFPHLQTIKKKKKNMK